MVAIAGMVTALATTITTTATATATVITAALSAATRATAFAGGWRRSGWVVQSRVPRLAKELGVQRDAEVRLLARELPLLAHAGWKRPRLGVRIAVT